MAAKKGEDRRDPDFDVNESPVYWFVRMMERIDRGEYTAAGECQQQLERLGWNVTRVKAKRQPARRQAVAR